MGGTAAPLVMLDPATGAFDPAAVKAAYDRFSVEPGRNGALTFEGFVKPAARGTD
jgi:hypothetical protein